MALNIYMTTWKYVQGESFKTLGIWIKKNLPRDQNKVDSMAGVNAYNFDQNVSRNELARMIIKKANWLIENQEECKTTWWL